MLEKLTPKQEAKMLEVKQYWLDYIFSCKNNVVNKEATKVGIKWLYEMAGHKEPIVIYVDSPIGCQFAVTYLKEFAKKFPINRASVRDSVRASVRASVRDSVGDSVGASVRDSVWASVWASVRDSVGASVGDSVWASKLEWNNFGAYCGISDYGWVSFYDFFTQIGVVNHEKFNCFKNIIQSGIYDTIQLNGFCIVSSLPKFISRDDRGRLHNAERSAIEFNDGYSIYYWHGVSVPAQWICFPETITKEDIIKEGNAEKRRCLMEILGETKYAELLDLVELGSELYNGRDVKLLKTKTKDNIINDYIYFIKVICPSTERFYYLCIPPREATDPISALAWTFGFKSSEYKLLIET